MACAISSSRLACHDWLFCKTLFPKPQTLFSQTPNPVNYDPIYYHNSHFESAINVEGNFWSFEKLIVISGRSHVAHWGVGDSSMVETAPRDTWVLRGCGFESHWVLLLGLMPQVCSDPPRSREQPSTAYSSMAFFAFLSVGAPQSCTGVTQLLRGCYAGFCLSLTSAFTKPARLPIEW